jgi:hypothetical protein
MLVQAHVTLLIKTPSELCCRLCLCPVNIVISNTVIVISKPSLDSAGCN